MVTGEHRRFPYLTFLDLAVTQQAVRAIRIAPVLCGKRHAGCRGDALAQRARGHIDARSVVHIGMALKAAADMAKRRKLVLGEEPAFSENGVETGGAMTL